MKAKGHHQASQQDFDSQRRRPSDLVGIIGMKHWINKAYEHFILKVWGWLGTLRD